MCLVLCFAFWYNETYLPIIIVLLLLIVKDGSVDDTVCLSEWEEGVGVSEEMLLGKQASSGIVEGSRKMRDIHITSWDINYRQLNISLTFIALDHYELTIVCIITNYNWYVQKLMTCIHDCIIMKIVWKY